MGHQAEVFGFGVQRAAGLDDGAEQHLGEAAALGARHDRHPVHARLALRRAARIEPSCRRADRLAVGLVDREIHTLS